MFRGGYTNLQIQIVYTFRYVHVFISLHEIVPGKMMNQIYQCDEVLLYSRHVD